jgi:DNA-binding PadR family transcriptional regulator
LVPEAVDVSMREPSGGYQLRVVQEVLLALLAKEASHGYQVRARLQLALGPLAEALNAGHVYVTLNRLQKAGLVSSKRVGQVDRPDRKVYELTAAGRERVMEWLADTSWPKPAPAEFHLKLVAAAAAGLGDPVRLVDMQRHALLAGLADAQRAALAEPDGSVAGLLLEGVVLRLQADLRWLEACAEYWTSTKGR